MPGLCQKRVRNAEGACGKSRKPLRFYRLTKAGDLGFEPRLTDPESVVLPLHQSPKAALHPTKLARKIKFSLFCRVFPLPARHVDAGTVAAGQGSAKK